MALLRVPEAQIPFVKRLLGLPPAKIDEFIAALSQAPPVFSTYVLAARVAKRLDLPLSVVTGILRVVAGLYLTRDREGTPLEPFVNEQIFNALKRAEVFEKEENVESSWPKLQKFFSEALALHRSVGTAAKTGQVMTQHEHVFTNARLLTDVRPVFHPDVDDIPDAAVIVHMLRITERDASNKRSDTYYALDSNDIRRLKAIIERAIKKEDTIRKMMSKSNIETLDPQEIY